MLKKQIEAKLNTTPTKVVAVMCTACTLGALRTSQGLSVVNVFMPLQNASSQCDALHVQFMPLWIIFRSNFASYMCSLTLIPWSLTPQYMWLEVPPQNVVHSIAVPFRVKVHKVIKSLCKICNNPTFLKS
jgi:hypothetical protein